MNLRNVGIGAVTVAVFVAGLWSGIGSAGWSSGSADPVALRATLVASKEVPRPTGVRANARGTFSAGLTRTGSAGTLAWRLTFNRLTGRAVAAHVHIGKPGKAGGVAAPLCGPCRSGMRGSVKVNARTVKALLSGGAYVNVHTAKNPAGEIRGQVAKGGTPPQPPGTTGTTTDTTTTTDTDPYPYP
jgi:hypothetical protein